MAALNGQEFNTRQEAVDAAFKDSRALPGDANVGGAHIEPRKQKPNEAKHGSREYEPAGAITDKIYKTDSAYEANGQTYNAVLFQDHYAGHPENGDERPHVHVRICNIVNGVVEAYDDNGAPPPGCQEHYWYPANE